MSLRDDFLNGGGCPIIDMHGHLGPFYGIHMPEAPLERMIAGMDRRGVERIVLSPHNALFGDTREGNREMLEAVNRHAGRVYGYCTINPNFPNEVTSEMDAYLRRSGVVGIKIHPSSHECHVADPRYAPMWERAQREKLLVLSHTWGRDGVCGSEAMGGVAEKYPDVRLLLGHSCYGDWDGAIGLARAFPNVYMELTAAYHAYGLIERMCGEAGAHKVLFGTDYPWFDPMTTAGCVTFAHISEDDMRHILYGNARCLLDEQVARNGSTEAP